MSFKLVSLYVQFDRIGKEIRAVDDTMPSIPNDNLPPIGDRLPEHAVPMLVAIVRSLEAVAFWCAIALPFLYVPLLVTGLETTAQLTAFLSLLALHALAIGGGYRYNRE
jgi:hypothetical protein